jgi:hypothetical protein
VATSSSTDSVWIPEHPQLPLYRARVPGREGKVGERLNLLTASVHEALQFPTEAACRAWLAANPWPKFVAREHGFCALPVIF